MTRRSISAAALCVGAALQLLAAVRQAGNGSFVSAPSLSNARKPLSVVELFNEFLLAKARAGRSDRYLGLLLKEPVFSHGQLYVAVSRVRSFDSLKVMVVDIPGGFKRQGEIEGYEGCYTKNVVDRSVL